MKNSIVLAFLVASTVCGAQTEPSRLSFALPEHAGTLSLAKGQFEVTEVSAKPNGQEFGIRAEDGNLHLLGFLFTWPEKPHLTAESCRDEMLQSEGPKSGSEAKDRLSYKTQSGVPVAIALVIPDSGKFSAVRAFVAEGELCGDLTFTDSKPVTAEVAPMQRIKDILSSLAFDPKAKPSFQGAFAYASVEYERRQYAGAAKAYRAALALVDSSDDPLKWRRVTTDQLALSLGISGDVKDSRSVNEAAIQRDPDYPLYYYNLACADAEDGNASAARKHLQQAFDRSANTLQGEGMPDPATDDSFLKLKSNGEFWAYVQTLKAKTKP